MEAHNIAQIVANNMLQFGPVVDDDLIAVEPILQDHIDDGHGATGQLVLIGFLAGGAFYRTTHTVAHCKNAFLKLNTRFAMSSFRRYGRAPTRRLSTPLATLVSRYMDTRMRTHANRCDHSYTSMNFFKNIQLYIYLTYLFFHSLHHMYHLSKVMKIITKMMLTMMIMVMMKTNIIMIIVMMKMMNMMTIMITLMLSKIYKKLRQQLVVLKI
jgi:hypothetical protein